MSSSIPTLLSESIKHYFKNYATFSGRTPRKLYWPLDIFNISLLVLIFISFLLAYLGYHTAPTHDMPIPVLIMLLFYIVFLIWILILIIPQIAATTRRLHDTGHSGWWQLAIYATQLLLGLLSRLLDLSSYARIAVSLLSDAIAIIFFIVLCRPSQPETNQYGPPPTA